MPDLDHRKMAPPFLREVHAMQVTGYLGIWDLRLAPPNVASLSSPVTHSLEHFLNDKLRANSGPIRLVAPMGCRTGLYVMTTDPDFAANAQRVEDGLSSILFANSVPLATDVQCGWAEHHSLTGAQNVARYALDRREQWAESEMARKAAS
ncbi:S-ribosylhomocysteine lyase [Streptomyces cupreus]|uniref:S-ribosylhomocysteine lyase n=1 Tax=Streptomyces cupreus TaxID=2759956 RepID=A0A7X1J1B1_9ACTN|nr:S-ribosylhomocysteine lyase [Streptomyces cupreus]MBC2902400.1 S-ribosylhomocysteine lyase [Streptomyces cupreus]